MEYSTKFNKLHVLFSMVVVAILALAFVVSQSEESSGVKTVGNIKLWPKMSQTLPDFEKRIDEVMAKMDDKDKVGQLIMGELKHLTPRDVGRYRLGGVLNGGGTFPNNDINSTVSDWLKLAQEFHDESVDQPKNAPRIPVLWGTDAVHGHNNLIGSTLFPHNIGLGATRNPDLMRQIGKVVAHETASAGIFLTFAPTIAVPQDDRWGRTYEGFAETSGPVEELGVAMLAGLQGEFDPKTGILASDRVGATAKHYLGDGGTYKGIDRGDTRITEEVLRKIHGESYVQLIKNNVLVIMASFNSWNGVRVHGHHYLMTEVLKKRMGFQGFVVADWDGHAHVPGCTVESCYQAINAGLDMFMVPEKWEELYKSTLKDVRKGRISQERLDDAVRRILRVKFILGLFDGAEPNTRASAGDNKVTGMAEHRAVARQAVRESLVLLKNNGNTLPIKPTAKVLVVGEAAQSMAIQAGGWSMSWQGGESNDKFPGGTTIYDGIKQTVESAGGRVAFSKNGKYKEKPDVALVVFGEDPYAEWHGDRKNLEFDAGGLKRRLATLQKLKDAGVSVVSVFLSGRPMWVTQEINASDAFVAAWLPGSEGGGIADVLFCQPKHFDQCNFKGKLSFSWPSSPIDFHQNVGQPNYDPMFEYDYGLSYTQEHEDMAQLKVISDTGISGESSGAPSQLGTRIFLGRAIEPYQLTLQSPSGAVDFKKPSTATTDGAVSAKVFDYKAQEDSQTIKFAGGKKGIWQIGRIKESTDWSSEPDDAAIQMTLQVVDADKGPFLYSLTCTTGCHATMDIGDILRNEEGGDWFDLAIPLNCLQKSGANLVSVIRPVVFHTDHEWTINVSTVLFDKPSDDARVLACN